MAKAYGDDLRRELLQAYDRGAGTLRQLAKDFGVSAAWAWKISASASAAGRWSGRSSGAADVAKSPSR
ncbi:MAG: hypothetical protein ABSC64_18090 [Candidatus Korobacteraceae bacterium]